MTPEEARGYIDGLSFDSKKDVWGEFPNRYDHWDAFEAFATIAGLRYEYLVAVGPEHSPVYATMNSQGRFVGTTLLLADRWATKSEAQSLVDELREGNENSTARVVSRLVSEVEVVTP